MGPAATDTRGLGARAGLDVKSGEPALRALSSQRTGARARPAAGALDAARCGAPGRAGGHAGAHEPEPSGHAEQTVRGGRRGLPAHDRRS